MNCKYVKIYLISVIIPFLFYACFPTYKASKVEADTLQSGDYSDIQAKVFKSDNSIIIFPHGFLVEDHSLKGSGMITDFKSGKTANESINLPLDSITAMTTYEENTSGGRHFASFFFGLTAPPLTIIGIRCISCPKCCFGSCPTVYAFDGNDYNLEAELFSECISKQLENNDLDLLQQNVTGDVLKLKITNEALETHYINKFNIVIAKHPLGTELYPANDNQLLLVSKKESLISAVNKEGKDVTDLLINDDNKFYRTGVEKISELKNGPVFDWINLKIPSAKKSNTKIVLKYRNTLLSTTLLYNVVIGSQGVEGLTWTKRMNEDPNYAAQFKMVYDAFSGIKIQMFDNGSWKAIGKFKDAGPINWKYIAAELPPVNSDTILLRLEFIPDNFMVDCVSVDTTFLKQIEIRTKIIYPFEIVDGCGNRSDSLIRYIKTDDNDYLKTEPGESYSLNYKIKKEVNCNHTSLIYSRGYYNEWVRGNWINNKNDRYTFNLYDINGTLSYLADDWIENSKILEREFFHSKFSLREGK